MAFIQYLETSINISELESVLSSPIINAVILGLLAIVLIMLAVVISKLNGNAKPKAASVSQTSKTSGGLSQEVVVRLLLRLPLIRRRRNVLSYRIFVLLHLKTQSLQKRMGTSRIAQNTQSFR